VLPLSMCSSWLRRSPSWNTLEPYCSTQMAVSGLLTGSGGKGMQVSQTVAYLGLDAALVGREPDLQEPRGVGGVVVHLRVHNAAASAEVLHAAPSQGLLLDTTAFQYAGGCRPDEQNESSSNSLI
jgi:hypothetical protein